MKKALLTIAFVAVAGASQAATVFFEDFNGGGTGVFGVSGSGTVWDDMSVYGDSNWTSSASGGNAMTADDDFVGSGSGAFDTTASASVAGAGFTGLTLDFDLNFQKFGTNGFVGSGDADRLEVIVNSTVIDTISSDTGSLFATPGVHKTYSLGAFDNSAFALKFRYVDETAGAWEWYAQVDDVKVSGTAVPEPASMAVLGLGAAALLRRRRK